MCSRLEAVGEPEGAEVRLLDQVIRVGRALRQAEGEAVERVEVSESLLAKVRYRLRQDQSR
jgi:hypothetical protein